MPRTIHVLTGCTAVGKTELALRWAEARGAEIVSCDSLLFYRGADIGTAKPTPAERARVPHHLIDVVTPAVEFTAGDYGRMAREAVKEITARGRTLIVAGGTGLYLRAFLDGLSAVPARDESLRKRLRHFAERRGEGSLHRVLRRLDRGAAMRIHANDAPKLIRAIEVGVLARQPMSEAFKQWEPEPLSGFRAVQIGLHPPRELLYRRIDERCVRMFRDGLVEETASLVDLYGAECRALRALGYAQACAQLRGDLSPADALSATQQGHRNYAKRQGTWFRKDRRVRWLHTPGELSLDAALKIIADA